MTFNRRARIGVFSTLFHYESKSIKEQNLFMGSNSTWFLLCTVTCRRSNIGTKWILVDVWNTGGRVIFNRRGESHSDAEELKLCMWLSKPWKFQQSDPFVPSIVVVYFLIFQWDLVDLIQNTTPCWGRGKDQRLLLIFSDREIKDRDGELH